MTQSPNRSQKNQNKLVDLNSFYSSLPIQAILPTITEVLTKQEVAILSAEPGAGKSTAVPLYLLENLDLAEQKIVMLEPRRLAAKSIATFLASLLDEPVGQTVGYQVRNERKTSASTRLEIVTEGVLTNRILQDPELHGTGLIIFDEFHERSIHADFGLALCKDIRSAYNEELKILVMSATLDSERLSTYLDNAEVIHTQGRCFPVSTHYLTKPITSSVSFDWLPSFKQLILKALSNTQNDVLAFLPGQKEINQLQNWLEETLDPNKQIVTPLYGSLKSQTQQTALKTDKFGRQKIVLATNIAETSLTIPNISAVIDSGWERVAEYDVTSGMTRLLTQRISQASAEQRQGRAGRVQAGECYRLWTESQQQALKRFTEPEITTTDLTHLRLAMAQWDTKTLAEIDWLTTPPKPHFNAATELLKKLGFITDNLNLSEQGKTATQFNTEPRFSRLLVAVKKESQSIQSLACDLVATLMDSHFYNDQKDADIVSRILALQAYRNQSKNALKQYPIKAAVAQQVLQTANRLQRNFAIGQAYQHSLTELQQNLGGLVAQAYPDRIAKQRVTRSSNRHAQDNIRYQLANGRGAVLSTSNNLKTSEWLAIANLDGQKSDGRIYLATDIDLEDIKTKVGIEDTAQYRYDAKTQKIEGVQLTKVGAIVLKESKLDKPDKARLQQCLQQMIIESELEILSWKQNTRDWLDRVRWLISIAPDQTSNWPDLKTQSLVDELEEWLFPYLGEVNSIQGLKALDIDSLLKARFEYQTLLEIDQQAPQEYRPPNGKPVKVQYQVGQLPKTSLILQSLFGELSSPKLAWGNAQLAFELLSPARRPIQITSDLAGFWQSSYFDVAKEMRGRYPKHRWPEEPLNEKPGKSIK